MRSALLYRCLFAVLLFPLPSPTAVPLLRMSEVRYGCALLDALKRAMLQVE